ARLCSVLREELADYGRRVGRRKLAPGGSTMNAAAVVVAAIALGAGAGGASANSSSPRQLAVNVIRWNYAERFDRVWPTIHPRYRRLVSRRFWEMCKHRQYDALRGVRVLGVKATGSHPDTVAYPLLGLLRVQTVTIQFDFHYLGRNYSQPTSMDF